MKKHVAFAAFSRDYVAAANSPSLVPIVGVGASTVGFEMLAIGRSYLRRLAAIPRGRLEFVKEEFGGAYQQGGGFYGQLIRYS